ncbi:MAG: hypothetical protein ACK4X2_09740 [Bacteroidota bacterium]|jgi:hypothetical protein
MNSNAMPAIVQIDTDNLKKLTTEVKETVASAEVGVNNAQSRKTFGITDLWAIRKNTKPTRAGSNRNF